MCEQATTTTSRISRHARTMSTWGQATRPNCRRSSARVSLSSHNPNRTASRTKRATWQNRQQRRSRQCLIYPLTVRRLVVKPLLLAWTRKNNSSLHLQRFRIRWLPRPRIRALIIPNSKSATSIETPSTTNNAWTSTTAATVTTKTLPSWNCAAKSSESQCRPRLRKAHCWTDFSSKPCFFVIFLNSCITNTLFLVFSPHSDTNFQNGNQPNR